MQIKPSTSVAKKSTDIIDKSRLDVFPRLGWVKDATPITELSELSKTFKSGWLGCKRDDLTGNLHGGSKVRKLDFLLSSEPYKTAQSWATTGAIGSGHMVACATAAKQLNRKIHAHLFWEPITQGIIENLSFTASVADTIQFYRSRITTGLTKPGLFLSDKVDGSAVIPVGTTTPIGILGLVRAGLELAEQVRNGELPEPKRIYVAMGTCGTAVGLAIGVALGGLKTMIHAVTSVERIISMKFRLKQLTADTRTILYRAGIKEAADIPPAHIFIDRSQLGKGYGYPTKASLEAVELMKKDGINIEPVYTGKAAAAMFDDLTYGTNEPILFWNTMRRDLPAIKEGWENNLPPELLKRING